MDQFEKYLQFKKEVAQATIKVVERFQQPGGKPTQKRTSNIDIVLNVLQAAAVLCTSPRSSIWQSGDMA
jgi:hypothetical protein